MTAIRWYTDEDVFGRMAAELRRHGHDAISAPELKRLGLPDEDHLEWATQNGRVIATFNARDFVRIHGEWLSAGRSHAGIVLCGQRVFGIVLRRLLNIGATLSAEEMRDRIEFVSNWPP